MEKRQGRGGGRRGGLWARRTVTVDSAEGNGRGWVSRLKTGSFNDFSRFGSVRAVPSCPAGDRGRWSLKKEVVGVWALDWLVRN